ncbi:rho GTPase-activating protein 11A isoform X1 [Pangasianodon hypophthalmus]|uniref:rho GTPase-activating protein 11A isoform X1 n=1 Tax=Pangasianodon hypophthalmus TaxID=310915 RepID=UPI002307913E|nr:rho GTPase-activating protein 11A isoform X1 [Pangasianodon hypophthalmus]
MKTAERNVVRLAVVQHLRATFAIKTKNWNKCKSSKSTAGNGVKVFGVALESLPHCHVLDYGDIPCFLVDACTCLLGHLDTEGLFRKSGAIVRVKALRVKLDQAEECLSTALPSDIAGLLKQFFRELPEPLLATDLQSSFLKAQELPTLEERTSATLLLSCVLAQENLNTLRYFCSFLKRVSQRSAENKMDSSNLSVIFAPNLFHWGDGTEKVNASTEKRLKLQAAVVQCLIDNAQGLGVVPDFLMAKVPAMLGCESGVFSPSDAVEEGNTPSGVKRCRRSLGDMVNGALTRLKSNRTPSNTSHPDGTVISTGTPVVGTPKRKLPLESGHSYGLSNKKRRSIKNLGLELLPNAFFGGISTPGSVHSASGTLDSCGSPSVSKSSRLTASSARRKSKRLNHRNVNRVESGKAGCFSPRVAKKETTRKSLRLRFSLVGKTTRDSSVISNSLPVPKGSEVIGWRLATQESVTSFHFKDAAFSPAVLANSTSQGTKYFSKSEDNLLTPREAEEPGTSWSRETLDGITEHSFSDTPMNAYLSYRSEPTIVISKPAVISTIPKSLCCATSAESLASSDSFQEAGSQAAPDLLKVSGAFAKSDSKGHTTDREEPKEKTEESSCANDIPASSNSSSLLQTSGELKKNVETPRKVLKDDEHIITFGQTELVPLSPLHIDSTLFEAAESSGVVKDTHKASVSADNESSLLFRDSSAACADCSQLIDALDIQSPVAFRLNSSITVQSTPFSGREQTEELNTSQTEKFKEPSLLEKSSSHHGATLGPMETRKMRVADHVQRFNMLTLSSPQAQAQAQARSPLKFQRTPVRQSVRRFNSLNQRKDNRSGWCATSQGSSMIKAVSVEGGHFSGLQQQPQPCEVFCLPPNDNEGSSKTKLPVSSQKPANSRHCALGDVTNRVAPKTKGSGSSSAPKCATSEVAESVLLQAAEKGYRGSPKTPLTHGTLLSAMKPIDL